MAQDVVTREDAFLEPQFKTIGDFRLRPFTLGSLPICKKLRLTQFTGEGTPGDLDQEEQMRQVAGFLWAHCEPIETVLRALRKPELLDEELLRYQLTIPISLLPEVMAEIQRVGDMAAAAQVEIVDKPAPAGSTQAAPPGN
jgi:hypothetical protein